ncbi:unnamed protein product, partial [Rotaria sp. Silwood1]
MIEKSNQSITNALQNLSATTNQISSHAGPNVYIDISSTTIQLVVFNSKNLFLFSASFRALCTGEKDFGYERSRFHRVISQYIVQGVDIINHNETSGT